MITTYANVMGQPAMVSGAKTNGANAGVAIDCAVFGNNFRSLTLAVTTGTITDGNHTVSAQECDTSGGSYTAVDPSRVQGSFAALVSTDSNKLFTLGVRPTKRFVQLLITTAGATTGGLFSAVAVLSNGSVGPVVRA